MNSEVNCSEWVRTEVIEARELTAPRYGSAKVLFDALDKKNGKGKARAPAKKI